ncbi:MAG: diguanylate cyclase [Solirubrobacterales bacterium]
MSLTARLRSYLAKRADPYAGGDLDNAQRLGSVFWALTVGLTVLAWPLSPPTEAIGDGGWVPAAIVVASGITLVQALRTRRIASWTDLLVLAYAGVIGLAVMQWLAGGHNAPYERLLLLPMGFVAAIHPPRRIAVFMVFLALVLSAPFVYDGWNADSAAAAAATYVIWAALAIGINLLMTGVRAQRLAHARDEAEAREEARVDTLTGLHNRRAFDEMLEAEVARARRLEIPLSMAMLDIENFKAVNDLWSYAEGDRALQRVAATLQATVRNPDLCFRWGGDEFAVILGGTTAADAAPLGERLKNEVAAACRRPDDDPIRLRFAVAELREEMPSGELVELAGMALTAAKSGAER